MEPTILPGLQERIAPWHTALLIVDMQKDFCIETMATAGTGRDLSRTKAIIPDLVRLRRTAREAGALVVHVGFLTLQHHLSDGGAWLAQRRRSPYANEAIAAAVYSPTPGSASSCACSLGTSPPNRSAMACAAACRRRARRG